MNAELDYDLNQEQWEALKALRIPALARRILTRPALDQLVALGLAEMRDGLPKITPWGRKVLIRGSLRLLLDVAA